MRPRIRRVLWMTDQSKVKYTRCYFNVRSKADMSQLNLYRTEPTTKSAKVKADIAVRNVTLPRRYGNSRAIWDHTMLPATQQRWRSRRYPSRSWHSRDARLSWSRHWGKGAQPVPKTAYHSGIRDKHSRPRWDSNLGLLLRSRARYPLGHCYRRQHWGQIGSMEFSSRGRNLLWNKGSPYSITERRVPELIPVLGSQPADDVSHKPGGRLPLLSARP